MTVRQTFFEQKLRNLPGQRVDGGPHSRPRNRSRNRNPTRRGQDFIFYFGFVTYYLIIQTFYLKNMLYSKITSNRKYNRLSLVLS
jgi:hypothetical protein